MNALQIACTDGATFQSAVGHNYLDACLDSNKLKLYEACPQNLFTASEYDLKEFWISYDSLEYYPTLQLSFAVGDFIQHGSRKAK